MDTLLAIRERLADLARRVGRLRELVPPGSGPTSEWSEQDAIAFNLLIACQTCEEISRLTLTDAEEAVPDDPTEVFRRLAQIGAISDHTAQTMARVAIVQERIASSSWGNNATRLHAAALSGTADIEAFATEIRHFIEG